MQRSMNCAVEVIVVAYGPALFALGIRTGGNLHLARCSAGPARRCTTWLRPTGRYVRNARCDERAEEKDGDGHSDDTVSDGDNEDGGRALRARMEEGDEKRIDGFRLVAVDPAHCLLLGFP